MNETLAVPQTKFNNGEVSPTLYGDVSNPKYLSSLRTCLNWLPIPQGALVKRPGTKFIAPVKDASYTPRLERFFFSDNQTYVLEIGNLYIRFYRQSKYVGNDGNLHVYGDAYGGGYYEIVTPFTTAMLFYLKFAQVGDTITICYGGQVAGVAAVAPRDLVHTSGANTPWTLSATPLKIPVTSVPNVPTVAIFAWSNLVSYKVGDFASQNNVLWMSIQGNNFNNSPPAVALNASQTGLQGNLFWTPAIDQAHPAVTVNWVMTSVVQDPNGITYETGPSAVLTGTGPLSADRQPSLSNTIGMTPGLPAFWVELYRKIYRAPQSGNYGLVATIGTGNIVWYDDGRAPDYTKQPPQGTDPFLVNGADSYPSVVSYLDQRRLFATSLLLPSSLILSRAGDLYNWDGALRALVPGADLDAINIVLASEVLEQVRSFVPMRRGLILTSQGEWALAGVTGGPVSRSSLDVKRQSTWGSSWLNPIKIGTGVLFNTAKSNMVRDLYPLYGLYADIWDGQDLTVLAKHFFDLHTIRDWAYQSVPYPVVWAVRDDGVLLSLTYQHAPPSFGQQLSEGICAWAQHTTGTGGLDHFEAICAVPEPPEDAVYVVVSRTFNGAGHRFIERFDNLICPASPYVSGVSDVRYGRYVDCSVTYDGHNDQIGYTGVNATVDSIASPGSTDPANYAISSQVKVTVAGGPFVAGDAAAPYGSGFVWDPENLLGFGSVKGRIVGFTDTAHVTVELDVAMTQAQVTAFRAGVNRWAIAKGSVSATHLTGYGIGDGLAQGVRGIMCLTDGDMQVPAAWAAGVASLQTPAVVVQTGIDYNADAVSLDAHHGQVDLRNRKKSLKRVAFEVAGTRGMFFGPDLTHLTEWEQRRVSDNYGVMGLATGYFEQIVGDSFNKFGQVAVRHFQPLPAVLTSLLREFRLGDT